MSECRVRIVAMYNIFFGDGDNRDPTDSPFNSVPRAQPEYGFENWILSYGEYSIIVSGTTSLFTNLPKPSVANSVVITKDVATSLYLIMKGNIKVWHEVTSIIGFGDEDNDECKSLLYSRGHSIYHDIDVIGVMPCGSVQNIFNMLEPVFGKIDYSRYFEPAKQQVNERT